jgi:tetratricopeptide (TPR) repeat protein
MFLAFSGFECASTQETTAKVALQRKDYKAAETALKKELELHPKNTGAWKLLGDVYYEQGRYAEMNNAYRSAEQITETPLKEEDKADISGKRYNAWRESYNRTLSFYNAGVKGEASAYERALNQIDTAIMIRPDYPENLFVKSSLLGALNRDDEVTKLYNEYIEAIRPDVEEGLKAGLGLGLTREQVETKLGKGTTAKVDSNGGFIYYQPKNLYVYFGVPSAGSAPVVEGWKFFTTPVPEYIAQTSLPLRSSPYRILGLQAYRDGATNKARYDDALRYLQMVGRLEPSTSQDIGQLISEIYVNSGRTAEARAMIEQQIKANPNEPSLYIAYGNLLFEAKDYSGAATSFRKVIDLNLKQDDPNLAIALFNLGAVYKNIGRDAQDSIKRVTGSGTPTAAQIEVYRKPLRESARYFEQLRTLPKKEKDYTLLAELANLYDVLGDKQKVQQTLTQIEGLEKEGSNSTDAKYWSTLSRLYAILGDAAKAEAADRKATDLMNR